MLRGDWRIILAAVLGLSLLGSTYGYYQVEKATRSRKTDSHYQPASDTSLPPPFVASKTQPKPYQPYCQQPQTQGDSDLCAQWSAVEAVKESNRLVRIGIVLSFVLGMVGIIATAVGTVLLYRSLRQTDLAIADNRRIGEAQTSAYLLTPQFRHQVPWRDGVLLHIVIENIGNSLASDILFQGTLSFDWNGNTISLPFSTGPFARKHLAGLKDGWFHAFTDKDRLAQIYKECLGQARLDCSGSFHMSYKDVFGNETAETGAFSGGLYRMADGNGEPTLETLIVVNEASLSRTIVAAQHES